MSVLTAFIIIYVLYCLSIATAKISIMDFSQSFFLYLSGTLAKMNVTVLGFIIGI